MNTASALKRGVGGAIGIVCIALAGRYPGLRLVIDHLAIASDKQKDEEAFAGLDHVLVLALLPNVAVKVMAMPCYTGDVYPDRKLRP